MSNIQNLGDFIEYVKAKYIDRKDYLVEVKTFFTTVKTTYSKIRIIGLTRGHFSTTFNFELDKEDIMYFYNKYKKIYEKKLKEERILERNRL